jgi:hypothetical protein
MIEKQFGTEYGPCQLRLKIPHSAGRKFPSPRQVVVYSFSRWVQHGNRLVKRRWALVETNPPRNSRLQTHRDDGTRGEAVTASSRVVLNESDR